MTNKKDLNCQDRKIRFKDGNLFGYGPDFTSIDFENIDCDNIDALFKQKD